MAFKKFWVMVIFAVMFLLSENVSAMTFSQPVKIGKIIYPPSADMVIEDSTYTSNPPSGKFQNQNTYAYNTIAGFSNGEDSIYVHHMPKHNVNPRVGDKDINKSVPIGYGLYGFTIYQIPNDSATKLYMIRPDEAMAVVLDYTLVGKKADGTFVKYFSFRDIWNKYVGNNRPNGRIFTENVHCEGDSIIIKYTHYEKHVKKDIGEIRFKWDDAAQWFGIEHIVY